MQSTRSAVRSRHSLGEPRRHHGAPHERRAHGFQMLGLIGQPAPRVGERRPSSVGRPLSRQPRPLDPGQTPLQ